MINVLADGCCRACGRDGHGDAEVCGACGVPRDTPDARPVRVGRVVEMGGWLRSVRAVALDEEDGQVAVLSKGEIPVRMPVEEFDRLKSVSVPGPAVIGPAGRLWSALAAVRGGKLSVKWQPAVVEQAAKTRALATLGARRAAALDALALGLSVAAPDLALNPTEMTWYSAHTACVEGDTPGLLDRLEQLPPESYSTRALLLLMRSEDLMRDRGFATRAAAQLRPFAEHMVVARALIAALEPAAASDALDVLEDYAATVADSGGDAGGALRSTAACIRGAGRPDAETPAPAAPAVRALFGYLAGRAGTGVDDRAEALAPLPVALLDDLIDDGVLTAHVARHPAWPRENAAYLRCRLDAAHATDADLAACSFTAETARRWYLADARDALTLLPADGPRVRNYQALASWRAGARPGDPELDGLLPDARRTVEAFERLRDAVAHGGGPHQVPDEVAADPTLWPLLGREARAGALELSSEARRRHQRCADWLDLCLVQRLVFEGRWSEVVAQGEALANRAAEPVVRAEARTMVACAYEEHGRTDIAYVAAQESVREVHSTGLSVNAGNLAYRAMGSTAALPHFARIADEDADAAVRDRAVVHAIDLWLDDDAEPDFPEPLRLFVREQLGRPHDDTVRRKLLMRAYMDDCAWLAAATAVRVDGPVQDEMLLYYRQCARSVTDGYPETLKDTAALLARLAGRPDPQPWVENELAQFVRQINDAVHCPFGEATHLVGAITALLDAGVLEPVRRTVFAVQAGAHMAADFDKQGDCLSPSAEQRFLFDPCAAFLAKDSPITGEAREGIGREVSRCLRIASVMTLSAAERAFEAAEPIWDDLTRQRQYAQYQSPGLARRQTELLDDLDRYLKRLRQYQRHLAALPPDDEDEPGRTARWLDAMADFIRTWSAETTRLRRFI